MKNIDLLEHGGATSDAPSAIRFQGYVLPLEDPRDEHFQWVLMALHLRHLPSIPHELTLWQHDLVFDRWAAAWDLPDFQNARRLAYLVDNYRGAIAHDLIVHAGLDLGEMWRARRWTTLLDVMDRLPAHSQSQAALAMDEDHAKMMAEAYASRRDTNEAADSSGPSLTTWTPEVAALTKVIDAVRGTTHAVIAVASERGKAPEAPKPEPRPSTPLERAIREADYSRRKAKHQAIVARVLPRKSGVKS